MRVLGHGIGGSLKEVLFLAALTFESARNPVVRLTIQMNTLLEFSHGAIYLVCSANFASYKRTEASEKSYNVGQCILD